MRKTLIIFLLIFAVLSLSGCALLQIPGAIIGGVFQILNGAVNLAQKLPWWLWL